jgi:hypothetical protein
MAEFILYGEDGTITTNHKDIPFSRQELENYVGGRIEILPAKISGIKGFENVYVVCEDGIYKFKPNPIFPQFYGSVLFTNKNFVRFHL